MATPNLTAGVTESVKPRRFGSPVCWRFQGTLGQNVSITTPIFDYNPDGWPGNVGAFASFRVVSVPSRFCVLTHTHQVRTVGARIEVLHLDDLGSLFPPLNPVTLYAQGGFTRVNRWLYELCGRRCQFRLVNTPLGTAVGGSGAQNFELTWEGRARD